MKRVLLFFTVMFMVAGLCYAQNGAGRFAGDWNGILVLGGQSIKMEFAIGEENGVAVGRMAAQGVKDIPVEVQVQGDSLQLQVKQLNMLYEGLLLGRNIMGTFSQNGFTAAMMLLPGKLEVVRPQTPKAPFPYKMEEVTFSNAAEGAILSGTLISIIFQMIIK